MFGAGSSYNPEELIIYGPVILVTVNYRLGPIGFLSTGKCVLPLLAFILGLFRETVYHPKSVLCNRQIYSNDFICCPVLLCA